MLPLWPPPEISFVIPVAGRDRVLVSFLDRWIDLNENDGTLDELFDHWIRGKGVQPLKPRWSIGRDVLGWWD